MAIPEEQGELLPKPESAHLADLNGGKSLAQRMSYDLVEWLSRVAADEEQDMEHRIFAAAEILSFATKGPY